MPESFKKDQLVCHYENISEKEVVTKIIKFNYCQKVFSVEFFPSFKFSMLLENSGNYIIIKL